MTVTISPYPGEFSATFIRFLPLEKLGSTKIKAQGYQAIKKINIHFFFSILMELRKTCRYTLPTVYVHVRHLLSNENFFSLLFFFIFYSLFIFSNNPKLTVPCVFHRVNTGVTLLPENGVEFKEKQENKL